MFTKSFLKEVSRKEHVSLPHLERGLKRGTIVIPRNSQRKSKRLVAIGGGMKIKLNTNIGTSTDRTELKDEMAKLKTAIAYGTDTVMDLSTGGNLRKILKMILKESDVPVGTVPLYEIAKKAECQRGTFEKIKPSDIFDVLQQQARDGVDFFTIHAGILKGNLDLLAQKKRVGGVVSRGGAIMARWMLINKKENPLYEHFDKIIALAKEYNITLSLGDALRPGAIADSSDRAQIAELIVLSQLVKKCLRQGVQVMVEGPGHIKLNEIEANVALEKKLCKNVPFYILGPLPTDIAAGYDHITSSIGGAIAGLAGADFLCVVTPAEHLRHPSCDDIKNGVIASKIAAHSVDILRFKDEWQRDYNLSVCRAKRQWDKIYTLTLDPEKAKQYRKYSKTSSKDICTMCGKFCSLKITEKCNLLR